MNPACCSAFKKPLCSENRCPRALGCSNRVVTDLRVSEMAWLIEKNKKLWWAWRIWLDSPKLSSPANLYSLVCWAPVIKKEVIQIIIKAAGVPLV